MKLAAGVKLGPYSIEHPIGAGGMGVVYRADDSRLGRKVAIKILPLARGEHLKRFEREARTIGSLNHPNLLTLYDVGDYEGTPFLVTEMLDGESLRARLTKGPLRLREAVQIAADVARGLAAAHEAGIVHRDVKPDNIFLTDAGRTKILDFGIAKLKRATSEMPAVDIGHDTTATPTTATESGQVIGTPGYMAPEQLDGGTVDHRTDIFALGVVLYEMICGHRAFMSDSAVEESYAILKTTPDPPKGATKAVARVVLRCLEKRPDARFQTAADLAFALDELDASTDPVARISKIAIDPAPAITQVDPAPLGARTRRRLGWARAATVAALVSVASLLGGVLLGRHSAPRGLAPRWPTVVEGGASYQRVTYHTQSHWDARLAPDGTSVIFSTQRDGHDEIVRAQIAHPSFSPTTIAGRLLDVSSRGELAVVTGDVPGQGGTLSRVFEGAGPRALADHVTAASWMPDGESLAVLRAGSTLELPIGTPILQRTTGSLDLLRVSPAGDRIAFVDLATANDSRGRVVVVDARGAELATSTPQVGIEGLAWSPDGTEVWFSNSSTIFGLDRASHERVVLRAPGRLVLADVAAGKILVAPSDLRLKMFTGPIQGPFHDVGWFDSSEVDAVTADGATIAFTEATGTGQTEAGYALFVRRGLAPATLLTHGFRLGLLPDGSAAIVVVSATKLQQLPTGAGTPKDVPLGPIRQIDIGDRISVAWSGRFVAVRGNDGSGPMHLWRIDLQRGAVDAIAAAHPGGRHPIAPDGEHVALAREAGGIDLVAVPSGAGRTYEGPPGEQPLSFSGDGTALFAMHLAGPSIVVERIELASGARAPWTKITPEQSPVYYAVTLSADGAIVAYSTNSDASDLYVLEPPAAP